MTDEVEVLPLTWDHEIRFRYQEEDLIWYLHIGRLRSDGAYSWIQTPEFTPPDGIEFFFSDGHLLTKETKTPITFDAFEVAVESERLRLNGVYVEPQPEVQ